MLLISQSTFVACGQEFISLMEHLTDNIEVVNTLISLQCLTVGIALSFKTPYHQNHHL